MDNFILHQTELVSLCMTPVLLASSFGLVAYKKRHNGELPPRRMKIIIAILHIPVIVFGDSSSSFCRHTTNRHSRNIKRKEGKVIRPSPLCSLKSTAHQMRYQ
jgi:hypothetical protein